MQKSLYDRKLLEENIKIPHRIAQEIILHKNYRAFILFLQLKPLYVSGCISNEEGKLPYQGMAAYLGLSVSGVRAKIKQLKAHQLIWIDEKKNIHLSSYRKFVSLFKPQFLRKVKKHVFKNTAHADILIRTSAIHTNFKKQDYVIDKKIVQKEIYGNFDANKDRLIHPEKGNNAPDECQSAIGRTDLSKSAIKKIRKIILKTQREYYRKKYTGIYYSQLECMETGFPDINPIVTLSCAGIGRLFGVTPTAGHYQRQRMIEANTLLKKQAGYHKIMPISHQVKHVMQEHGHHAFGIHYPTYKHGFQEKFHLRLADQLSLNVFFS